MCEISKNIQKNEFQNDDYQLFFNMKKSFLQFEFLTIFITSIRNDDKREQKQRALISKTNLTIK